MEIRKQNIKEWTEKVFKPYRVKRTKPYSNKYTNYAFLENKVYNPYEGAEDSTLYILKWSVPFRTYNWNV